MPRQDWPTAKQALDYRTLLSARNRCKGLVFTFFCALILLQAESGIIHKVRLVLEALGAPEERAWEAAWSRCVLLARSVETQLE